jgi:phage host-nuclease inhibitor protein Gam
VNKDDAPLMLALRTIGDLQRETASLHRSLYQAEQNLAEQERLTEQARRWAVTLEAELRQVSEDLSL